MEKIDFINYIIKNVSRIFPEIKVVRSDFENMMGFILVFEKNNTQISFTLERGFNIEGEIMNVNMENNIFKRLPEKVVTNNGKNYLLFHSIDPSLINLNLSIENIDLIIDFLYKHKEEIFVD